MMNEPSTGTGAPTSTPAMLPTIAPTSASSDRPPARPLLRRAGRPGRKLDHFAQRREPNRHSDRRPTDPAPRLVRKQPRKPRRQRHDQPIARQREERREPRRDAQHDQQQPPTGSRPTPDRDSRRRGPLDSQCAILPIFSTRLDPIS